MTVAARQLARLWKHGTDFLGTRTAIMGGAMTWVSEHHLVSALSNAGAFGDRLRKDESNDNEHTARLLAG